MLGTSLLRTNPDYTFHIAIVDKKSDEINYAIYSDFNFTFVDEIGIKQLDNLIERYNIIELNTSVKASYFKHLLKTYPNCSHVHYFDPDIKLFERLDSLDSYFNNHSILLTPHILHPIPDDYLEPRENMFLNYGIYNLGYIGLKNHPESFKLLDWWENHTIGLGYMDVKNGYFVDQLWMNHVPLFFNGVHILREKGFNCAPWNIQERHILEVKGCQILLDDQSLLTFYHFSSFNPNRKDLLSSAYTRNTFDKHPLFRHIYETYAIELLDAGYNEYKQLGCGLYPEKLEKDLNSLELSSADMVKKVINLITPPVLIQIIQRIRN